MLSPVYRAAADLQEICKKNGWRFCFIGGIAALRWRDPRMTDDADITLFTDFGFEEPFIDELLKHFTPRRKDAAAFALQARVLLLQHDNNVPLDVALGGLPFESRSIDRSSLWLSEEGCEFRTCSAEDLIVHKAFASRTKDWGDIESIVQRHGPRLNWKLVFEELKPFAELKEDPEILDRLREILAHFGLRPN